MGLLTNLINKKEKEELKAYKRNKFGKWCDLDLALVVEDPALLILSGDLKNFTSPEKDLYYNCPFDLWFITNNIDKSGNALVRVSGSYMKSKGYNLMDVVDLKDNIEKASQITMNSTETSNIIGGGIVGGILFGPLGAIAGAALSKKQTADMIFACELKDGRKFIGATDPNAYSMVFSSFEQSKINDSIACSENDTQKCFYCAEIIKKEARICRFCQKPVVDSGTEGSIP